LEKNLTCSQAVHKAEERHGSSRKETSETNGMATLRDAEVRISEDTHNLPTFALPGKENVMKDHMV